MARSKSPFQKPPTHKFTEFEIQCYVVQEARRGGYVIASGQEGVRMGRRAASKAKAAGMLAGTPDLRLWLKNGLKIEIELKGPGGKLSDTQKEFHKLLSELGHTVHVVYATCPVDGWNKVKNIILNS